MSDAVYRHLLIKMLMRLPCFFSQLRASVPTNKGAAMITVTADTFRLARTFTISRGSKTEARVVTCSVTRNGHRGWGEGLPYPRYGETVEEAARRPAESHLRQPLVMGVDVARFGDDSSVMVLRKGRDARAYRIERHRDLDLMTLASRVMERAMAETGRRRERQLIYNTTHGITPRGVVKRI